MKHTFILPALVTAACLGFGCSAANVVVVRGDTPADHNEAKAVMVVTVFAQAEEIYHRNDYNKDGVLEYAQVLAGRTDDFKRMKVEPVKIEKPSDAEKAKIDTLIKTLNDDNFTTREKAMTDLVAFGSKAYEQAAAAAKNSADAEAAQRCKKIVETIDEAGAAVPQIKLNYHFGLIGSDGRNELMLLAKPIGAAECPAGCDPADSTPSDGYLFRVLTRQGDAATGGKRNYIVSDHMTLGYGMLAFPSDYGTTGKKCFMINSNGTIFQRDFGSKAATEKFVKTCVEFNPTPEWTPTE